MVRARAGAAALRPRAPGICQACGTEAAHAFGRSRAWTAYTPRPLAPFRPRAVLCRPMSSAWSLAPTGRCPRTSPSGSRGSRCMRMRVQQEQQHQQQSACSPPASVLLQGSDTRRHRPPSPPPPALPGDRLGAARAAAADHRHPHLTGRQAAHILQLAAGWVQERAGLVHAAAHLRGLATGPFEGFNSASAGINT